MTAQELAAEIGINGAVDIAVMTLVIYAAWLALRRSPSLHAARGALILGALYLLARQFNLSLTAAALEAFFVVLALAAVVVFREELRRLVERVALLGRQRRSKMGDGAQADIVATLSSAVAMLAKSKTGALLVVAGSEPVDGLLQGGTTLRGELSKPLLSSIFDPSSLGHDGAVVIQSGQVQRFGCHLPSSTNFEQLGDRGTRHAAGLGLSERCDALAVVVSEERGTVSIARDGGLRELSDPEDLATELRAFLGDLATPPNPLRELLMRHHAAKIAALGVAMLSWVVLVFGARPAKRSFEVPVEPTAVVAGRRIASVTPATATVTLSAARREFYFFNATDIRLAPSLAGRGPGLVSLALSPEQVSAPRGLSVVALDPSHVAVMLVPSEKAAGP